MLTKVIAEDYKPYRKRKLNKWIWFIFAVIPMGIVLATIVLITMTLEEKERKNVS